MQYANIAHICRMQYANIVKICYYPNVTHGCYEHQLHNLINIYVCTNPIHISKRHRKRLISLPLPLFFILGLTADVFGCHGLSHILPYFCILTLFILNLQITTSRQPLFRFWRR